SVSLRFQPVKVFSMAYVSVPPDLVLPLLQVFGLLAHSVKPEDFSLVPLLPPPHAATTNNEALATAIAPASLLPVRIFPPVSYRKPPAGTPRPRTAHRPRPTWARCSA